MPSLRCDCDYLADAESEADLLVLARTHARQVHGIDLDDGQLVAALNREATGTPKRSFRQPAQNPAP